MNYASDDQARSDQSPGDQALDERMLAGDTAALAEAFSRCRQRLGRMVQFRMDRRLAGRVDPDDLLQEAYLQAAQRLDSFAEQNAGERRLSGFLWLRLIVSQTLVDAHRRHLGAQMRDATRDVRLNAGPAGGPSPVATSMSIAQLLVGKLTSPSQAAVRAEISQQLQRAIASMSALDQEVIALRHFEELSNGEIAEVLGIEVKAASIRYVRALRRLKGVLAGASDFHDLRSKLSCAP
ncbi:ECF RNA polymerase sigma factor SigW [Pirellulimonas nuda]|uniref:ECF RNA polymerase sigma factor SigW n=1 Tax=Pirellulimonas nuda TaxID=2528009 RepID=A0A518D955_9BACT|nr:sigma-70 family RNA polymerase sigma factor [Pirellulimonas nuda]QDU87995.1 ECF RNA polymerase sigma factor SigW [Pirellulimonas nuda]